MYHLRVPQTEEELERYYQFRWEMLRKPLHQPKGSERDAWDAMAHHQMVVDEQGNLVAVGRLYINADNEASIRFMAVHPDVQDKGLGTLMAMTLESVARQEGVKRVTCSAREDAVEFFAKLGFVNQGEITTPTTTPIRHFLMIKPVATLDDILHRGDWCAQLQQAWYEHIPLSEKMGVRNISHVFRRQHSVTSLYFCQLSACYWRCYSAVYRTICCQFQQDDRRWGVRADRHRVIVDVLHR